MGKLSLRALLMIAIRDLGRNRRRSFLTLSAVALGLALLVLISGLMAGSVDGALQNSIRLQTGHLQVRDESYDEEKVSLEWEDLLDAPQELVTQIEAIPGVQTAAPLLWANGIVTLRDESVGVRVFGIDPLSDASAPFKEGIIAGEFLGADDRSGILIGHRLAKSMGLEVGDQVNLLVTTADEQPDEAFFTIRGLYNTNVPAYDETTVFLPISKAQAFTGAGERASAIFILLVNREYTGSVAAGLQNPLYEVLTWQELNQVLFGALETSAGMMSLMYMIVLAVVAVVVANTLLMAVFERTREMGILASLGMKARQILIMFLLEAGTLGIMGIALGVMLGSLGVAYLANVGWNLGELAATAASAEIAYGSTVYAKFAPTDTIILSAASLVITLLASLYPAWIAARMEPVDALRAV